MSEAWSLFHALGDRHRLEILRRAAERGTSPMLQLFDGIPITRQAAAKHLSVLAAAGLVSIQRQGREQLVSVESQNLRVATMYLAQIESSWSDRLNRLKQLTETKETMD
ncbi:MAG: ArsR/SmtB family transcription factor [Fimbriimonas sp.]